MPGHSYTRDRARRSVFLTTLFRVVSQVVTFASYVVLVRSLDEATFGQLNLLYAIIPVIGTLASFGIEQTLRRFQPEYLARGDAGAADWLYRTAAWLRLASNLAVVALLLLVWRWLAPVFELERLHDEFLLFALVILLHFQASLLRASLASHMRNGLAVALTVLLPLVKLAGYLLLAREGLLDLRAAILVDAAGYACMYAGLRVAHARHRPAPGAGGAGPARGSEERRRVARYALYNNFNDAGTLLLTSKSDNFFIAALLNPVAVGAYGFYTRLNEMVSQILPTRQLLDVIQPLVFAVPQAEARTRLPRYFALLLDTALAVQLPITVFACAYHAELVEVVFAGRFAAWSWLLPLVVGFAALNRISEPVTLVAQYEERSRAILVSKLFGVYNALAILAFAPLAGLYGVAIATGTAQLFKNGYIWWAVRATARWENAGAVVVANLAIGGGAVALCIAAKPLVDGAPWPAMACGVAICALATVVYLRSGALSAADRQILAGVFRGRERRVLGWLGVLPRAAAGAA